jgi:1-acyl-sn-glycerol-3-phosphate acyltransferase
MRVALATGAPVVPVIVSGTDKVNPVGSRRWHFAKVHLTLCPPLDLTPFTSRPLNQQTVRATTDHLMHVLQASSGQPYVDSYADRKAS